ncbi:MAG: hypothetical protein K0Q59_5570 [Paenibacillus sp.]|nr:hypothetical protein [Paenibacillus sp.]
MDIQAIMSSLAMKRPIFHNEADFQHALAWELREHEECKIRLERRMEIDKKRRAYLDIWVEQEGRTTAIELKYKMRAIDYTFDGEAYSLLNQGAQDIGRYDVLKDLQRLEQMVKHRSVDEGYLIYLTNDSSYFQDPGVVKTTADREFRIHEGKRISGTLCWSEGTGEGTMKGREEPIVLEGDYVMNWVPYSRLDATAAGNIQCLLVAVSVPLRQDAPGLPASVSESPAKTDVESVDADEHVNAEMMPSTPSAPLTAVVRSIAAIPISQYDLRDKLAARLKAEGYRIQVDTHIGAEKLDIWAEKDNQRLAIEVRYKTALLQTIWNGSHISLKSQRAQDISRYDYLSDVAKLERIAAARPGARGCALLITNDHNYWKKSTRAESVDEAFRIHQGRTLHGRLSWNGASGGTVDGREEELEIKGSYSLNWQPYLTLGNDKNEQFHMLIVEVVE